MIFLRWISHLLSPLCFETFRWPPIALTRPPQPGHGHLFCCASRQFLLRAHVLEIGTFISSSNALYFSLTSDYSWMPLLLPGSTFPFNLFLCDKSYLISFKETLLMCSSSLSACASHFGEITCEVVCLFYLSMSSVRIETTVSFVHSCILGASAIWKNEYVSFIHSLIQNVYFIPKYVLITVAATMKRHCALLKVLILSWGIHSSKWGCVVWYAMVGACLGKQDHPEEEDLSQLGMLRVVVKSIAFGVSQYSLRTPVLSPANSVTLGNPSKRQLSHL